MDNIQKQKRREILFMLANSELSSYEIAEMFNISEKEVVEVILKE